MLQTTDAHVVAFQEHWLSGEDDRARLSQWALRAGWKVLTTPADPPPPRAFGTRRLRGRAGVGVAVRAEMGLGWPEERGFGDVEGARTRALAAVAQCTEAPPIAVYSVYLYDGEGLAERNVKLMAAVAEHAARAKRPFIIAGDWNVEPAMVNEAWMPDALRARIVATEDARGTHKHARGYSNLD